MTVRTAELLMGLLLAVFSVYLMVKSAELPIGWERGKGPGGGAWPFWLATGMLVSCVAILVRWWARRRIEPRWWQPFIDREALPIVGFAAGSLLLMVGLIGLIGVYGAIPLFMIAYLKLMGRHGWVVTIAIALGIPIAFFFFFEGAMRIPLPKGVTEELFYPLYPLIY